MFCQTKVFTNTTLRSGWYVGKQGVEYDTQHTPVGYLVNERVVKPNIYCVLCETIRYVVNRFV